MSLTREERIARELQKKWPNEPRHHYIVVASPEHGVIGISGASDERMRELLRPVIAEGLGVQPEPTQPSALSEDAAATHKHDVTAGYLSAVVTMLRVNHDFQTAHHLLRAGNAPRKRSEPTRRARKISGS